MFRFRDDEGRNDVSQLLESKWIEGAWDTATGSFTVLIPASGGIEGRNEQRK